MTWLIDLVLSSSQTSKMASNCHKGYDSAENSHWLDLPMDVLLLIGGKLIDIEDYIRFGAVCTSWRTALWLIRKDIPPQLPVFMFPNIFNLTLQPPSNDIYRHNFFSSTGSNRGISPMRQYVENWFGVSHGWLLIRCGLFNEPSIELLNPFSSVNNVIKFPDLPVDVSVRKGVLSHNPTLTSKFIVMVIYYCGIDCGLAYIKSGDESWNHLYPHEVKHALKDIIFYKDQFYAMNRFGEVLSCDITSATKHTIRKVASSPAHMLQGATATKAYLVESSGDLLWVKREVVLQQGKWFNATGGFCIFKFQTTGRKWTKLNTLGGQALFLSEFSSLSLLGLDFSQCEPNHIYFLGDDTSDAGVFNLEDASFKLQTSDRICGWGRYPIWVQPTLDMSNPQKVSMSRVKCEDAYYNQKSIVEDERDDILSHERGNDSVFNIHNIRDGMIAYPDKNPSLKESGIVCGRIRNTVLLYENFMFLWSRYKCSKAIDYPLQSCGDGQLTKFCENILVGTPMALDGQKVVEEHNITQLTEDLEDSQQHGVISSWEEENEDSRTLHLERRNLAEKFTAKAAIRAKKKAKKKLRKLKKRTAKMKEDGSVSSNANSEEKPDAEDEISPSEPTKYTLSLFGHRKEDKFQYTVSRCIHQCRMYPKWLLVALLMLLAAARTLFY